MAQSLNICRVCGLSAVRLLLLPLAFRVGADAFITTDTEPHTRLKGGRPAVSANKQISSLHNTSAAHVTSAAHESHHAVFDVHLSKTVHESGKQEPQMLEPQMLAIVGKAKPQERVPSSKPAAANSTSAGHNSYSSQLHSRSPSTAKSPKWAPPHSDHSMSKKHSQIVSSAVVTPRSQIILKKLEGGRKSCSRMKKLDQAFILKLLQNGDLNRFHHRSHRAKGHSEGKAITSNAKSQNQSAAVVSVGRVPLAIECYVDIRVSTKLDKDLRCPDRCPLMVKEKFSGTGAASDFKCVGNTVDDCKSANPKTTVPDLKQGVCRTCDVKGCASCIDDGTDTCSECASGYQLSNGKCHSQFAWVKYACFGMFGLAVLFIICWIVVLYHRPCTNQATLVHALDVRARTKLHQPLHLPEDENGVDGTPTADGRQRKRWPMTTNLCTTNVAGPGLALSFNFQVALIVWAVVMALTWLAIGLKVEYPTLLILGTHRAMSEWENCWIVQWGYNAQNRLMWAKVGYLVFVYLFTFLGCIILGIYQLRCFDFFDQASSTHKNFCARITGLPRVIGSVYVEEEIKRTIETVSEQRVIGVSVCWDMGDKSDVLMQVIESELDKRDTELHGQCLPSAEPLRYGILNRVFSGIESLFLSPTAQKILTKSSRHNALPTRHSTKATRPDPKDEETGHVFVVDPILELHKLQSTSQAFVVFDTEIARNTAVEIMSNGVEFRGVTLKVEEAFCEPDSLMWGHMHSESVKDKAKDITWGVCMILMALFLWTIVVFLPFVWIALGGSYANGQEPTALTVFTFGMVVVAGNALMYVVCGEVADRIQFQCVDSRELCNMGLYLFACIFNVALDMICAYYVAYYAMVGVGMRTYDGTPLQDVETFTGRFETYAMQRELGRTLLGYTVPFTTLVAFLIEPFLTIYVPWKIMVAIVRTKPEIQGVTAEAYLKPLVMDMSRYADLLLNVILAVGILFFPGGFNLAMFIGLAISHIYIFAFDHYRVLRSVTACDFASMKVDWWAQWVLCLPCAGVVTCIVFKSNCEDYMGRIQRNAGLYNKSWYCADDSGLLLKCAFAFIGHIVLHTLVLVFLVPCFRRKPKEPQDEHYQHCARRVPVSWFSANPVHCLRSQFIYDHSPACDFSMLGKQHLVRVNPSIGCYFSEKEAEAEDYYEPSMEDLRQLSSRKAVDAVASLTSRLHRHSTASKDDQHSARDK